MINEICVNKYCQEGQMHLIENYELAISDETQVYACHHRRETDEHKTMQQLIDEDLYYNRPAEELIFLTKEEHMKLHMLGNQLRYGRKLSEETKQKMSEAHKGEKNPNFGKHRYGSENPMYDKHHTEETREKMSKPKKKLKWKTPDGEIVEMSIAHVKQHHPDWLLISE